MADWTSVWLSVCLTVCCWDLGDSQERCPYLKLNEGDVCKEDSKGPWSCKTLNDCPKSIDQLNIGEVKPEICGFKKTELVVCCEPEPKIEAEPEDTCQYLDLNEGDICKQDVKGRWTCKVLHDCPKVIENLDHDREEPKVCGFNKTDVVVCCQPETKSKSKQMCEKYAEYVFIRLSDPLSGGTTNYDTCNLETRRSYTSKRAVATNGLGVESKTREYPHMGVIGFGEASAIQWLCSGSLISDRFILTAAHCATGPAKLGSPRWVRLGDHNLQSQEDEEKSEAQPSTYEVVQTIVHPEYKRKNLYNDIALLKLNTTVFFTEFIRPVCLQAEPDYNGYALATAWGKYYTSGVDDVLLTLNVSALGGDRCNEYLKNSRRLPNGVLEDRMICAGIGNINDGPDSCQGDSGGPLQVLLDQPYCMYSQVGVESYSAGCGSDNPFIFTRVSYYVPWIESVVWP